MSQWTEGVNCGGKARFLYLSLSLQLHLTRADPEATSSTACVCVPRPNLVRLIRKTPRPPKKERSCSAAVVLMGGVQEMTACLLQNCS